MTSGEVVAALLSDVEREAVARRCAPEGTYRLQFHAGFTFRDAAHIIPYLRDLGVSHIYASPYLKARPGSTHGYDVVDHAQLNPDLGDKTAFDEMVTAFRQNGLGQ